MGDVSAIMYRCFVAVIALLVTGCVQTATYYHPIASEGVHVDPGRGCTGPSASYNFHVERGINGFISASVGQDSWGIYYGFALEKGAKLKMLNPHIEIYSEKWEGLHTVRMPPFRLSVYGGLPNRQKGYIKYYEPLDELTYTGLNKKIDVDYLTKDSFQSSVTIDKDYPEAFTLKLPKMLANGTKIQLPAIRFEYTEKRYLLTCIQ